jgi:hypothetical protein
LEGFGDAQAGTGCAQSRTGLAPARQMLVVPVKLLTHNAKQELSQGGWQSYYCCCSSFKHNEIKDW